MEIKPGDEVFIECKIKEVRITKEGTRYVVEPIDNNNCINCMEVHPGHIADSKEFVL